MESVKKGMKVTIFSLFFQQKNDLNFCMTHIELELELELERLIYDESANKRGDLIRLKLEEKVQVKSCVFFIPKVGTVTLASAIVIVSLMLILTLDGRRRQSHTEIEMQVLSHLTREMRREK